MATNTTRYELKRGAKRTLNATFDTTNLPSGSLSGVRVDWYVRKTKSQPTYDIQKTSASGSEIQIIDADAGTVEMYMQPSDTLSFQPGSYYWTFRLYSDAQGLDEITPDDSDGDIIILDSALY